MWPDMIVLPRHISINTLASVSVVMISPLSSSSCSFPLKLSMYPFTYGLPGPMNRGPTSGLASHRLAASAKGAGAPSLYLPLRTQLADLSHLRVTPWSP